MKGKRKQRKMKAKLGDDWYRTRQLRLVAIYPHLKAYEYELVPHH